LERGGYEDSTADIVGTEIRGTEDIFYINERGGNAEFGRGGEDHIWCIHLDGGRGTRIRYHNEFVQLINSYNLIGVRGDGLNRGNAESIGVQVNDFGNLTLYRRQDAGNIRYGSGFGKTCQGHGGIG
jgi:hypothetical protein